VTVLLAVVSVFPETAFCYFYPGLDAFCEFLASHGSALEHFTPVLSVVG
jgi:hypothetical protein